MSYVTVTFSSHTFFPTFFPKKRLTPLHGEISMFTKSLENGVTSFAGGKQQHKNDKRSQRNNQAENGITGNS
jgi:hypothetical protein